MLLPVVVKAQADKPMPPVKKAERLTYDEKTNTWLRTNPPVPGTEDGDLDIVRKQLAHDDFKAALKSVKKWIKKYGTNAARYAEALNLKAAAELARSDYRAAHDDYQSLLNQYGGSAYAEGALRNDFRVAEQYLAGKRRKAWHGLLRVKDREAGVKILDDITANYPDTELAELAQRAKADYYFARGELELAEQEYATFAKDYPRSRFHPMALLRSAEAALASYPGIKFDDKGLVEAQERFGQFAKAYPSQAEQLDVPVTLDEIAVKRADKTLFIGKFYQKTKKINAACYYYRQTIQRWPDTTAAAEARGRLTGLGQSLETPVAELTQAQLPLQCGG
jgi:outer membrane assembly lipoprotein YfiO